MWRQPVAVTFSKSIWGTAVVRLKKGAKLAGSEVPRFLFALSTSMSPILELSIIYIKNDVKIIDQFISITSVWHAKCAMLLTETVENMRHGWWAHLIKIEHSNNQTPLDTTPAKAAEISIVPPTWERWVLSNQQSWDGVVLAVWWTYASPQPTPSTTVVLNTPNTTPISRQLTEEEGEFQGRARSLLFLANDWTNNPRLRAVPSGGRGHPWGQGAAL